MYPGVSPAGQALDHIRELRPSSCPNEGFVAQLGLFQDMRCSLDTEHPVYRMWCVQQVRYAVTHPVPSCGRVLCNQYQGCFRRAVAAWACWAVQLCFDGPGHHDAVQL
jgi:hypothetical protein